ncbi:MAG TPA: hypothetical protein PK859_12320 [Spirochaetota bacterium]|nr:hypothetical protein [Spirochaetota bacterium]
MKQKCLMILGMHRSGTSAIAGVFDSLGVSMGKTLMESNDNNPKGYYENLLVQILNESKLLPHLHLTWDSTFPLITGWENDHELHDFYREAEKIIQNEYGENELFGIKDPRICRLFPFWAKVLDHLEIETYVIIPIRNPLEVAASLKKRNNYSMEKSILLWVIHLLEAENNTRQYKRIFVSYSNFINNTEKVIRSIDNYLGLELTESYISKKNEIENFINEELKHYHIENTRIQKIPEYINSIISITNYISNDYTYEKDREKRKTFTKEGDKFREALNFFLNDDIKNQIREDNNNKNKIIIELRERINKLYERIKKKDNTIEKMQQQLLYKNNQLENIKQQLNSNSLSLIGKLKKQFKF